ncbi:DNA recombination protein RmuC, partial [Salmonella enterica subsp. enterica serovar Typhimurium]|nr:DNA recombination protein RmuC [Salmonella enterica subsp. enterica serovar Typhimurium]
GQSLDKAQLSYRQAMNKLSQGRGNLIGQVEGFRTLGVEVKRPISPTLAEKASLENQPEDDLALSDDAESEISDSAPLKYQG